MAASAERARNPEEDERTECRPEDRHDAPERRGVLHRPDVAAGWILVKQVVWR